MLHEVSEMAGTAGQPVCNALKVKMASLNRIRIRLIPETWIQIPDHLVEVRMAAFDRSHTSFYWSTVALSYLPIF